MLQLLLHKKQLLALFGLWIIAAFIFRYSVFIIVPATMFYLYSGQKYTDLVLGFIIVLCLSDSHITSLTVMLDIRPIYIILLTGFLFFDKDWFQKESFFWQAFLLFFLISIISLIFSPIIFSSLQKTISYFLMLFTIPVYIANLLLHNKREFLSAMLFIGTIVLIFSFLLRFITPDVTTLSNRYSGIFGNPNGMGIFLVLYTILFTVITTYYTDLLTPVERWAIIAIIVISLILCASRGAMFSIILFLVLLQICKISVPLAIIFTLFGAIAYQFLIAYIEELIVLLGLGEYFRMQTLETGSGRIEAYRFAWEKIQENFFIGKGFGFSEYYFHKDDIKTYLNALNHQGGTHNTYLTLWLDTGLLGLIFYVFAWAGKFFNAFRQTHLAFPMLVAILFSTTIESWLAASLNPFTILFIVIICLIIDPEFYDTDNDTQQNQTHTE